MKGEFFAAAVKVFSVNIVYDKEVSGNSTIGIKMIKHIVMWKFKSGTETEMNRFLDGLRGLMGQIEVLRSLEVGVSVNDENNYDAVLITTFDSMEDLRKYKVDPRHVAVASICKAIRESRGAVDFEF